ncbi:MAG TPA: M23 family metallopeptidase [Nocardioidaceae bacterium]|nr:M23 family metallopeptidase [Nocardioidaceae bacterium]
MNRVQASAGVALVVLLAALLTASPATPSFAQRQEGDGDGDGVAGLDDACPASPRAAATVAEGCAAIEIVRRPEILTAPTLTALRDMLDQLDDARPLAGATTHLERARGRIDSFATQLRQGDVCNAARTYDDVELELHSARHEMDSAVDRLAGVLLGFDARAEDASDGDITVAFLRMLARQVERAVDTGLAAGSTADALCAAVAGRLHQSGQVTDVDDAAGLVTLQSGQVLALAKKRGNGNQPKRLHEGLAVIVSGTLFQDGTGVAEQIGSEQRTEPLTGAPALPCMVLRIAPVQPFAPYDAGPYTLHSTRAYADAANVLHLERGMRLAAEELGCAHSTPQGLSLRYAMRIEVIENLAAKEVVAYDFQEGDHPVAFPSISALDGQIKTTVLRTSCKQFADGTDVCDAPVEQHVQHYDEILRPRGHYSSAVYSDTVFGVKDNQIAGDFDTATVVAMDLTDVPVGTNAHFVGEGYAVANGVSSRPQVVEIGQGQKFAIYDDDEFIPNNLMLFQLDIFGVEHEAGLIWPGVEGTRNGSTFRYSSKLPKVVRDLVSACPAPQDSWYRLPFFGGWPHWTVNQGNYGDPSHGHDESQRFAWDFDADQGTDIAAARGGKVVWVVEDEHLNVSDYPKDPNNPDKVDPNYKKLGNYIWILHDDATVSAYLHVSQWGALVSEGDVVHRGQHIAEVGNTGYSSHPHLHYEGGLVTVDWHQQSPSVVRLPVLFEAELGGFDPGSLSYTFTQKDCFVPQAGEVVQSTQQ